MIKLNVDKLTDFERQMATMFELHLPKVGVSDNMFQIPDMPAIKLGCWPFAKMMKPLEKGKAVTWYRRLSWRGQILAHQLHKRALVRPVEAPPKGENKSPAGLSTQSLAQGLAAVAGMAQAKQNGILAGMAQAKQNAIFAGLAAQNPGARLNNLYRGSNSTG